MNQFEGYMFHVHGRLFLKFIDMWDKDVHKANCSMFWLNHMRTFQNLYEF